MPAYTLRPKGYHGSYRFYTIPDRYGTIKEVQAALREIELKSSNLIPGLGLHGYAHVCVCARVL